MLISDSEDNVVQGNLIGTDVAGTTPLPNQGGGILLELAAVNNTLGGTVSGTVTSSPAMTSLAFCSAGPTGNFVEGNLIGTNANNALNLGNGPYGVAVLNAPYNTIGGAVTGADNVIGNSTEFGLLLSNGADHTWVQGNDIGLGTTGAALPNGLDGVAVVDSDSNIMAGNVISGNGRFGVFLNGSGTMQQLPRGQPHRHQRRRHRRRGQRLDGVAVVRRLVQHHRRHRGTAAGNVISGNGRSACTSTAAAPPATSSRAISSA